MFRQIGIWMMRLSIALFRDEGDRLLWVKEEGLTVRTILCKTGQCCTEVFDEKTGWRRVNTQSLKEFQDQVKERPKKGTWVMKRHNPDRI